MGRDGLEIGYSLGEWVTKENGSAEEVPFRNLVLGDLARPI
jgi:hypothetical protein